MFFESHLLSHISISRFCMLQTFFESVLLWFLSPQPSYLGKVKCYAESCSASSKKNQCCAVTSFPLTKEITVWATSVSSKVHFTRHFQGVLFSGWFINKQRAALPILHSHKSTWDCNRWGLFRFGIFLTVRRRVLNQTALDDPSARRCSRKYWKGKKFPFIYSYSHPS